MVEKVAAVLEEEFFDECTFDAHNCAKAALEACHHADLVAQLRVASAVLRSQDAHVTANDCDGLLAKIGEGK
jgi:hypothetical protein